MFSSQLVILAKEVRAIQESISVLQYFTAGGSICKVADDSHDFFSAICMIPQVANAVDKMNSM
jgi:hypothetical protein